MEIRYWKRFGAEYKRCGNLSVFQIPSLGILYKRVGPVWSLKAGPIGITGVRWRFRFNGL